MRSDKVRTFRTILLLLLSSLLCGSISGCAYFRSLYQRHSPSDAKYLQHRVRYPGESLSKIALWYTRDYKNWKRILLANPKINPQNLKIGTTLRIPRFLLKTKKPFTATQLAALKVTATKEVSALPVEKPHEGGYSRELGKDLLDPYSVSNIRGCEGMSDTILGLDQCAEKIGDSLEQNEQELERLTQ